MRHVYPTNEVPHKWAHQAQDNARNAYGSLFFRGATIYSYRESWPLARIYRKGAQSLVLTNSARYSNTTAQHQSLVNRAASHLPRVDVLRPDVQERYADTRERYHAENLAYLAGVQERALKTAERALTMRRAESSIETARQACSNIGRYLAFFGIRRKAPVFPEHRATAALERARKIASLDPAALDKRERERAKRAERNRERDEYLRAHRENLARGLFYRDMAARTDWRLFSAFDAAGGNYYRAPGPVMLRIVGDEIVTSAGARVPLAAAPMVWNLVQRGIARGGWTPSGLHAVQIGDYAVTEVRADGTLVVGCHEIPHSELRSMARTLGLS